MKRPGLKIDVLCRHGGGPWKKYAAMIQVRAAWRSVEKEAGLFAATLDSGYREGAGESAARE
jgi:hypothetical protein